MAAAASAGDALGQRRAYLTAVEAVDQVRSAQADVVVKDIRMPELDGLAATEQISADDDLAGVRILILTTLELDEYVGWVCATGRSWS